MARLRVLAASAAAGACVLAASPASAQTCLSSGQYPVAIDCTAGSQTQADGSVTFSFPPGSFAPGEVVDLRDANGNLIGTFTAAADGSLRGRIRASVLAALGDTGIASLTLVGRSSGARLTVQVDLAAAAAEAANGSSGSGSLPRTGSTSTIPLAASGIALTMLGAGMVIIARRARDTALVAV